MDSDLFMVVGIVVAVMAVPAVLSAFSAGRPPRAAAVAVVVGGALIVAAVASHPGGYRADEIPSVVERVVSRYLN